MPLALVTVAILVNFSAKTMPHDLPCVDRAVVLEGDHLNLVFGGSTA